MRLFRVRFTIRLLIVAVALVGLNLAGAVAVSKHFIRKPPPREMMGFWNGRGYEGHYSDGTRRFFSGNPQTGFRLERIEPPLPPSPTLLQIWFPLIVSGSITLLILIAYKAIDRVIRRLLARFTIRSITITTFLVSLNLAGAIATWGGHPRKQLLEGRESYDRTFVDRGAHGLIDIYGKVSGAGYRLAGLVREELPLTIVQIWAPLIASASITVLVLLVSSGSSASLRRSSALHALGDQPARQHEQWFAARWLTIATALIALNLVGVVSRPSPTRSQLQLDYLDLFGDTPRTLIVKLDGSTVQRRLVDGSDVIPPEISGARSQVSSEGFLLSAGTIDFRLDGSIVAYAGSPEQMLSRPHLVRPPQRSFLEIWASVIASGSITLLALALSWRQVRGHRMKPVTENE